MARRYVRTLLADQPDGVVSDTELVVTELVANASLHGRPPIVVRLSPSEGCVRVEVEDAGRTIPVQVRQRPDAMTGRGLSLVGAVSAGWGVNPCRPGKVVWAEISPSQGAGYQPTVPTMDPEAILDAWPDLNDGPRPVRYTVRLGAVPTELLLSAKAHIDNVVREFSSCAQPPSTPATTSRPQ